MLLEKSDTMSWKDILKNQKFGTTEYWGPPGKIQEFDSESSAKYRMKKLNSELQGNEPEWEFCNLFRKPMLKRVWPQ